MIDRRLPDFLVVGAAKSGSTSIFNYLNEHPKIFIPLCKECRFFSQMPGNLLGGRVAQFQNDIIKNITDYKTLFCGQESKLKGDISNDYLFYYKNSVKNIKKFLDDDVKIVIILRNPITRAYSNYLHSVRLGSEPLSFESAIIHEPYRKRRNFAWPFLYVQTGMYYNQVLHYLNNFKYVRIFLYEDLFSASFIKELLDFIGVEYHPIDTSFRFNRASIPRIRLLNNLPYNNKLIKYIKYILPTSLKSVFKHSISKFNSANPPTLSEITREYLKDLYRPEIDRLQKIIQRDLFHWIN